MTTTSTANNLGDDNFPLLSADQIAAGLGISGRCVLNWYYNKIIPAAVHQGKVIRFERGQVMEALGKARRERARDQGAGFPVDVVRMALWLLAPDLTESPAWILTRKPTVDEDSQAAQLAMAYFEEFHGLATVEEKRHYISGVLAANHLANELGGQF